MNRTNCPKCGILIGNLPRHKRRKRCEHQHNDRTENVVKGRNTW